MSVGGRGTLGALLGGGGGEAGQVTGVGIAAVVAK